GTREPSIASAGLRDMEKAGCCKPAANRRFNDLLLRLRSPPPKLLLQRRPPECFGGSRREPCGQGNQERWKVPRVAGTGGLRRYQRLCRRYLRPAAPSADDRSGGDGLQLGSLGPVWRVAGCRGLLMFCRPGRSLMNERQRVRIKRQSTAH